MFNSFIGFKTDRSFKHIYRGRKTNVLVVYMISRAKFEI